MRKCLRGFAVVFCASCMFLTGCAGMTPSTTGQDIQKTPLEQTQDYVTSVDSHASEISKKADEYIEAIGKSDTVAAKLKLEEVLKALDECANVETPDAIKDEGERYKQACNNLKEALNSLNDVANGKVAQSDLQTKLQEAQDKYTQAATTLSDADKSLNNKLEELKNSGGVSKPQA